MERAPTSGPFWGYARRAYHRLSQCLALAPMRPAMSARLPKIHSSVVFVPASSTMPANMMARTNESIARARYAQVTILRLSMNRRMRSARHVSHRLPNVRMAVSARKRIEILAAAMTSVQIEAGDLTSHPMIARAATMMPMATVNSMPT